MVRDNIQVSSSTKGIAMRFKLFTMPFVAAYILSGCNNMGWKGWTEEKYTPAVVTEILAIMSVNKDGVGNIQSVDLITDSIRIKIVEIEKEAVIHISRAKNIYMVHTGQCVMIRAKLKYTLFTYLFSTPEVTADTSGESNSQLLPCVT